MAANCQPWLVRRMYHGISSGRLPYQMMRNCENEMYAQIIVKANKQFAQVVQRRSPRSPCRYHRAASATSDAMANAMAARPLPTKKSTP